MGFFDSLKNGLKKTKDALVGRIDNIFRAFKKLDDDLYDELEETLIEADLGVSATENILELLRERVKEKKINEADEARTELYAIMSDMICENSEVKISYDKPTVILVIGVNGVGKTTSIGKLASVFTKQGKKVLLGAADTFRAAAIDQLDVWAKRSNVGIIKHGENSDPASVVFDSVAAMKARKSDILIVDTAGRLHNKQNLMNELAKINRVIDKEYPEAQRETLLVLDGSTGQNAYIQAKEFSSVAEITGLVLTKMDGTAKGGVVFSICSELKVPVKYIGVGEGIDDLQEFSGEDFVKAIFGE